MRSIYPGEDAIPTQSHTGLIILVACLVSVLTIVGMHAVMKTRSMANRVQVPEVVGLQLDQAEKLARAAHLSFQVMGETIDPGVPKGSVARQSPLAGTSAAEGSRLVVTLSSGPQAAKKKQAPVPPPAPPPPSKIAPSAAPLAAPSPPPVRKKIRRASGMVSVPKVTGMRLMYSRRRLEARGLVVGRISYARDEDHMETYVLSQSPQRGTEVPRGSAVDMVINRVE